jgi:hypothetical protein
VDLLAGADVGARAERAAGSGDDERAKFVVALGGSQRVGQFHP